MPLAVPPVPNNITQDPVGVRPSEQASRRLWTPVSITAPSAHGAHLPAPLPTSHSPNKPFKLLTSHFSLLTSHFPLPSPLRPVSHRDTAYQPRATLWEHRPSPAFCRNAAYLHPADSSRDCQSWWCSRRCGPAIPAESGYQCHSPARASQPHAAASDTSLGAKHHNAGPTQREGVQPYSRAPASRSGARKNPDRPPHRLTPLGHSPESLHSSQYLVERPCWPLTWNISNAKAPWEVVANSVDPVIVNDSPSPPLNFRRLEAKDTLPNAPFASGYSTRYREILNLPEITCSSHIFPQATCLLRLERVRLPLRIVA